MRSILVVLLLVAGCQDAVSNDSNMTNEQLNQFDCVVDQSSIQCDNGVAE